MRIEKLLKGLALSMALAGSPALAEIEQETFGTLADGRTVTAYTLTNANGMVARIIDLGGIVTHLTAPDREGRYEDVVLGFDALDGYLADHPYFGALIGRYGNRIGGARFTLDGEVYELPANNGPNHLHGGPEGFDKRLWRSRPEETGSGPGVVLEYTSADGEMGYPGTLEVSVRYTLSHENALLIDYEATTDAPTPVNLTHHGYFNLSGNARRDILGHWLEIDAARFTPVDEGLIPTGELREVADSPFDFRQARVIGADIDADDEQIRFGGGYDHNWALDSGGAADAVKVARLGDPASGRVMEVWTTEPGLQFYSGNFLDGSLHGKGVDYTHRRGLCLETQHFPDSPNQPDFPGTILRPGETYRTHTRYVFTTAD